MLIKPRKSRLNKYISMFIIMGLAYVCALPEIDMATAQVN